MHKAVIISALVPFVSSLSVSSACTQALTGIATNPDAAACLSPGPLVPIFLGSGNTSIVGPIDTWVTSVCASQPCSNTTLAAIVANVTSGCGTELSAFGYTSSISNDMIANVVEQFYPTVRKVVCLKTSNENCVTQTLKNFESVVGALSIQNIITIATQGFNATTNLSNLTCTDCAKAAYNIANQDVGGVFSDNETKSSLQAQCGASFTDGTTPSSIFQGAASQGDPKTKDSGGVATTAPLAGVSALLVFLSVFSILA